MSGTWARDLTGARGGGTGRGGELAGGVPPQASYIELPVAYPVSRAGVRVEVCTCGRIDWSLSHEKLKARRLQVSNC